MMMTSKDRIIVSQTVVSIPTGDGENNTVRATHFDDFDASVRNTADSSKNKSLDLMMICCEENPPYGPAKDTAVMFLELLCQAYERKKCSRSVVSSPSTAESETNTERRILTINNDDAIDLTISITVYHAQSNDYPLTSSEWFSYDGILIPGSLSAAYDTHIAWIERLQSVIRNDIHRMNLKTVGVCFGHQCFAHAFGTHNENGGREGRAIKCPTGSKAGRITCKLTQEGRQLLLEENSERSSVELLYTHGDMVHSLPEFAISLGGNANVPIEACAYFSSKEEKILFQKQQQQTTTTKNDGDSSNNNDNATKVQPYAFTFQAHPEYTSPTGFNINYFNTVQAMEDRGFITQQLAKKVCWDAKVNFEKVQDDSLNVMIAVAARLGWF